MAKLTFNILLVLCFVKFTESCFALGGCGLGLFLSPYSMRYCNARAKGSKIYVQNDDEGEEHGSTYPTLLTNEYNPDQHFLECCKSRQLPIACQDICSFSNYTKKSIQQMYFNSNGCPLSAISNIHFCATGGNDHRSCCLNKGVSTTSSGDRCLIFCDTEPAIPLQLDLSYVNCYDKFDEMKECFMENKNIKKSWNSLYQKEEEYPKKNIIHKEDYVEYDSNKEDNFKRFNVNTGGSSWF